MLRKILCILFANFIFLSVSLAENTSPPYASSFHLIDKAEYDRVVSTSRIKISHLLQGFQSEREKSADEQVAFIVNQLIDIPFNEEGSMGEGDWQPQSTTYQPGAIHINQHPVYRLDQFDCQTFTQMVMALLHSRDLTQFDQNILKIAYGAANNPQNEIVHYYNRNHFIDGDFNPVNQRNGWLVDITSLPPLSLVAKKTEAIIDRNNWLKEQQKNTARYVHVFNETSGVAMVDRFTHTYQKLPLPKFHEEKVTLYYLSKFDIAHRRSDGHYEPNEALLNQIETPAVVELVRDVHTWGKHGIPIKKYLGSETNVSHLGILYRETFHEGELIYHQITCENDREEGACIVKEKYCQQKLCREWMFAHATKSYPNDHYWYADNGHYVCSAKKPAKGPYTPCNRIEKLPLFDYLTSFQYQHYWYMEDSSFLGFHVEKLTL